MFKPTTHQDQDQSPEQMTSRTEQIRTLIAPPLASTSHSRTLHQIDSQYPSFEALNDAKALEVAVKQAELSKIDLDSKLATSTSSLEELILRTQSSANLLLGSAQELSLTRHSLADQLSLLTQELLPVIPPGRTGREKPSLLADLGGLQGRLAELERTRNYVRVIEHTLRLSVDAIEQIQTSSSNPVSESSLGAYVELQVFAAKVAKTCKESDGEEGAPGLTAFVEGVRDRTWKDINKVLSENLLRASERLKWPSVVDYSAADPGDRAQFENTFINLLHLQQAGEKIHAKPHSDGSVQEPDLQKQGLYPLLALLHPIALRFKFHFDGKRPTNRLDKPEWYFTHVLNVIHEHRLFMKNHIQPLLLRSPYASVDAQMEFTRILFSLLTRKLRRSIPSLLNTPPLLAHTIYQTLIFDGSIRDEGFDLGRTWEALEQRRLRQTVVQTGGKRENSMDVTPSSWKGLSEVILGNKEWFDAWLAGEKKFVEDQYLEIISSQDAWTIADDTADDVEDEIGSPDADSKTTNSARRVKALIQSVTERYHSLPHLHHRVQFLFVIQLPTLELYLTRITTSLDAYETLSSSFVRAVPGALAGQGAGVDTKRLTSGVDGLSRLVKALLSARCIKTGMETWGEDLFFLETWHDIQENPVLRARAETHRSLPRAHASGAHHERVESALFDELISQYDSLVVRAEDMVVRQVSGEVESGLKGYFTSQWDRTGQDISSSNALSLPAMLVVPVSLLSSELSFLATTLPPSVVTTLYRRIGSEISTHIIQRSVSQRGKHQFTADDGRTFAHECMLWVETCRMALTVGGNQVVRRVELPWTSLLDVAAILGAPPDRFDEVVSAVYDGTQEQAEGVLSELGVKSMTQEEVGRLVRARSDCHRSPMGEAVMQHEAKKRGLPITVDSAGTAAYHVGEDPDERTVSTCKKHSVPINHFARAVSKKDFDTFDYILASDSQNLSDLQRMAPKGSKATVALFGSFGDGRAIADPYYGGINGFEKAYKQCVEYSEGLFQTLYPS